MTKFKINTQELRQSRFLSSFEGMHYVCMMHVSSMPYVYIIV